MKEYPDRKKINLDIWQGFEYAVGIKYARVLNMLWYSYNNFIIIVTNANVITLEFLSVDLYIQTLRN